MDQHLGASITLSFGLVVVFAIVFYQPDQSPPARASPGVPKGEASPTASGPPEPAPPPPLMPSEPLPPTSPPVAVPVPVPPRPLRPTSLAAQVEKRATDGSEHEPIRAAAQPEPAAPDVAMRRRRPSNRVEPGAGFALAIEGETLRDVARRIYGSADEAEALWRLNRDLIRARDARLADGTLLRAP